MASLPLLLIVLLLLPGCIPVMAGGAAVGVAGSQRYGVASWRNLSWPEGNEFVVRLHEPIAAGEAEAIAPAYIPIECPAPRLVSSRTYHLRETPGLDKQGFWIGRHACGP
jgi:hypothetical protein